MAPNLEPGSRTTLRGNYVMLRADTLRLLLPQGEVGAAEYLATPLEAGEKPGLLRPSGGEGARRFAALSAQMTLLPHCPADRFVVAALDGVDDDLGWCWNELQVLIDTELTVHPLPRVLQAPHTPVGHYAEQGGEIAFLCSARQLRSYALAQGI